MIANAGRGAGFGGLARYLLHGEAGQGFERAEWVTLRNLAADDPELGAVEMRATAEQAPRVKRPVYHLSLSAAPGEELTRKQWERVADRILRDLGLERHQAVLVAHRDTAHPHIHLMVNRVDPERLRAWRGSNDYSRIERSLRRLEQELELRTVPGRHFQLPGQERPEPSREPSSGERRQAGRTGELPPGERWRRELRPLFRQVQSWAELERALAERGLRLEKRGRGLVVTDGTHQLKASRIDRHASIHGLEKRFGDFKQWRRLAGQLRTQAERLGELEARRLRLEAIGARLSTRARRAHRVLEEHRRLASETEALRRDLAAQLGRVFRAEDLPQATRKLEALLKEVGPAKAAEVLRHRPQQLGRLHGTGAGPLKSPERAEASAAAGRAAQTLGRLTATEDRLDLASNRAGAAASSLRQSQARMRRLAHRLRDVTEGRQTRGLQRDVTHLALRVGLQAVRFVLPAPAARLVTSLLRASQLLREVGQVMGR